MTEPIGAVFVIIVVCINTFWSQNSFDSLPFFSEGTSSDDTGMTTNEPRTTEKSEPGNVVLALKMDLCGKNDLQIN